MSNAALDWRGCASPSAGEREARPLRLPDSVAHFAQPAVEQAEDFTDLDEFLKSHYAFLEDLRTKVNESSANDRVRVFENLPWQILKDSGKLSWFGLTSRMVDFIKRESSNIAGSEEKVVALQHQLETISDQIDELKLSIDMDSDIFKIAAGTLLYTVAVLKHVERKVSNSRSCCSPVKSWGIRKSMDVLPRQLDEVFSELKVLQDNLMFATLAAIGNRVSQSVIKKVPSLQTTSFGVEEHAHRVIDHFQKTGVCFVGIHGNAGVGKTTLLNEVVAKLQHTHKRLFAFVEVSEKQDDLRRLQTSLLQQLGGGKKDFASTAQGRNALLYQLQKLKHNNKSAWIAIDNLFDIRLIGELFPHSLGKVLPLKTSIIVTSPSLAIISRLDQLCRPATPQYHYLAYKLPTLGAQQAKALFLSYVAPRSAWNQRTLTKYVEMVDQIVPLCDGNPLALKVTGSYFADKANQSREHCSLLSKRLKAAEELDSTEDQIFMKLQVIYDRLDRCLKEAFLDISIFFRGWDWRIVERIVGQSQMKSLVSQTLTVACKKDTETLHGISQWTRYSEYPWKVDLVGMHDLLATIGSRRAQGNRIVSEDQIHLPDRLLVDGPGNELSNIQGLSLLSCKEAVQGHMLEKMQKLRLLVLHDTRIQGQCTKPLHSLQFFYWGRSQPSSEVKIPFQMSRLKELEMLILRAHEIDLNLKYPPQLKDLTMIGCNNVEELPDDISQLTGLVELHLYGCSRLQDLTERLGNLRTLSRLRIENCGSVRELPRSLGTLLNLKEMDLSGCHNLLLLPPEVGSLVKLEKLNLSRCKSLTQLPPELGNLRSLMHLNCGHCPLTSICSEIGKLEVLEELSLTYCARLEKLPKEVGNLVSLERLNMSSCICLKELPQEIGSLQSLRQLDMSNCSGLLRLPQQLWGLSSLQSLNLDYCKHLSQLPKEIGNLTSLQTLSLNCCTKLTALPNELFGLPSLQVLNLVGCTGIKGDLPRDLMAFVPENAGLQTEDRSIGLDESTNPSVKLYSIT